MPQQAGFASILSGSRVIFADLSSHVILNSSHHSNAGGVASFDEPSRRSDIHLIQREIPSHMQRAIIADEDEPEENTNTLALPQCSNNDRQSKDIDMSETLHIVCPHCNAVNRIPAARLGDSPKCGKCHQPLFTARPVALTAATFATHIGRSDIPVLVDFWAPWCGPCKMMAPAFEQAAAQLEPRVCLAKVDTEAEQQLGAQFGIRSIPTLALFRGGREVARQPGAMGMRDIVDWVRARL